VQAGRRGRHCLIASSMNTTGGNVPTRRSGVTSGGQRHESGCDTQAPTASPKSGLLENSSMNFSHRILSPASAL